MRRFAAALLIVAVAVPAIAAPPRTLSYQGVLQGDGGLAVPDGDHAFVFTLWSAASGGEALWQETRTLPTEHGLFEVVLGEQATLDLPFDVTYWLAVTVDGEDLAPRTALTAAPYALRSAVADSLADPGDLDDGDWVEASGNLHRLDGNVGIGTTIPSSKLDVAGTIRASGFQLTTSPVLGHVLTSDASGNASWQSPPSGGGLDLPFSGLASHDEAVFRVDNQGTGAGLHGVSTSEAPGVLGNSPTGPGVSGTGTVGVRGLHASGTVGELGSDVAGVRGTASGANAAAVLGSHSSSGHIGSLADAYYGVFGQVSSSSARAVMGAHNGFANWGYLGGDLAGVRGSAGGSQTGVRGDHTSGNVGILGGAFAGVLGTAAAGGAAVLGTHSASGNEGWLGDGSYGVFGQSPSASGRGVMGSNSNYQNWGYLGGEEAGVVGSAAGSLFGVKGQHTSGMYGILGTPVAGGFFYGTSGATVELATAEHALSAFHPGGPVSVKLGTDFQGVYSRTYNNGDVAVWAQTTDGVAVWAEADPDSPTGNAGVFTGDIVVIDGKIKMGPISTDDDIAIHTVNANATISLESGVNNIAGLRFRRENIGLWTLLHRTWQNQNLHIFDELLGDELMTFESNTGCVGVRNENPAYPLDVNGTVRCASVIETSDQRLKRDVQTLTGNLDKVSRLRGVRYVWNERAADLGATPGQADIGLLAQEVETVYPELVTTGEGGMKGVNYGKLTAVLIGAVKELKEQNDELSRRVAQLESEVRHGR